MMFSSVCLCDLAALAGDPIPCGSVLVGSAEQVLPAGIRRAAAGSPLLAQRYDARPGTTYLFRPDQHVCARWRAFDLTRIRAAIERATAQPVN
jgi:3-(3-hydroxy-phenyl)propionate hydroxylase